MTDTTDNRPDPPKAPPGDAAGEELARLKELRECEQALLELAPAQGLLYPADALKLADFARAPGKDARDRAAREIKRLREASPWLFAAGASPARERLAPSPAPRPEPERPLSTRELALRRARRRG